MESPKPREYPQRPADCDKHGPYISLNYIGNRWSGCRDCAREEEDERKRTAEQAAARERRDQRIRMSGLEGRFLEATFDNFIATDHAQQKVHQACRDYVSALDFRGGKGLWLIGPPGTGKTHLGSAMVRAVIEERDRSAAIYSGREIIRLLRSTWGNRERGRTWDGRATDEEGMIEDIAGLGLLVIDEVGVSFGTDSEHVQLFDIIDARYKHQRPTVLLSNLPTKGLKDAVGERAYDRLREGAVVLVCNWTSHRGQPAKRQSLEAVK